MTAYGVGFFTGGQDKGHTQRTTTTTNAKFDLTWQANNAHSLKFGYSATFYNLDNKYRSIRNEYAGTSLDSDFYKPVVYDDTTVYADIYKVKPKEFSAYLQDKFEKDEIVINFGLRYDQFDANTIYPSQRRNPTNSSTYYLQKIDGTDSLDFDGNLIIDESRMSTPINSTLAKQYSPRLGFAFLIISLLENFLFHDSLLTSSELIKSWK